MVYFLEITAFFMHRSLFSNTGCTTFTTLQSREKAGIFRTYAIVRAATMFLKTLILYSYSVGREILSMQKVINGQTFELS